MRRVSHNQDKPTGLFAFASMLAFLLLSGAFFCIFEYIFLYLK